jgi:hypothetical protein
LCSGFAATGVINERMSGSAAKTWIFVIDASFESQIGLRRKSSRLLISFEKAHAQFRRREPPRGAAAD